MYQTLPQWKRCCKDVVVELRSWYVLLPMHPQVTGEASQKTTHERRDAVGCQNTDIRDLCEGDVRGWICIMEEIDMEYSPLDSLSARNHLDGIYTVAQQNLLWYTGSETDNPNCTHAWYTARTQRWGMKGSMLMWKLWVDATNGAGQSRRWCRSLCCVCARMLNKHTCLWHCRLRCWCQKSRPSSRPHRIQHWQKTHVTWYPTIPMRRQRTNALKFVIFDPTHVWFVSLHSTSFYMNELKCGNTQLDVCPSNT